MKNSLAMIVIVIIIGIFKATIAQITKFDQVIILAERSVRDTSNVIFSYTVRNEGTEYRFRDNRLILSQIVPAIKNELQDLQNLDRQDFILLYNDEDPKRYKFIRSINSLEHELLNAEPGFWQNKNNAILHFGQLTRSLNITGKVFLLIAARNLNIEDLELSNPEWDRIVDLKCVFVTNKFIDPKNNPEWVRTTFVNGFLKKRNFYHYPFLLKTTEAEGELIEKPSYTLEQAKMNLDSLEQELENAKTQIEYYKTQASTENTRLIQEISQKNREIVQLKIALSNVRSDSISLYNKWKASAASALKYENEFNALQTKYLQLMQSYDVLKNKCDSLKYQLKMKDQKINNLEIRLTDELQKSKYHYKANTIYLEVYLFLDEARFGTFSLIKPLSTTKKQTELIVEYKPFVDRNIISNNEAQIEFKFSDSFNEKTVLSKPIIQESFYLDKEKHWDIPFEFKDEVDSEPAILTLEVSQMRNSKSINSSVDLLFDIGYIAQEHIIMTWIKGFLLLVVGAIFGVFIDKFYDWAKPKVFKREG